MSVDVVKTAQALDHKDLQGEGHEQTTQSHPPGSRKCLLKLYIAKGKIWEILSFVLRLDSEKEIIPSKALRLLVSNPVTSLSVHSHLRWSRPQRPWPFGGIPRECQNNRRECGNFNAFTSEEYSTYRPYRCFHVNYNVIHSRASSVSNWGQQSPLQS